MYFVMIHSFLTASEKTYSGITIKDYPDGRYRFEITTGSSHVSIISLAVTVALMKLKSDQIHNTWINKSRD